MTSCDSEAAAGSGSGERLRSAAAPREARRDTPLVGMAVSERSFWALFALGSAACFALLVLPGALEGTVLPPLLCSVAPLSLAALVAWRRRDLLRPDYSLPKTLGIHVALGIAYGALSGAASTGLLALADPPANTAWSAPPAAQFGMLSVSFFLLYAVLAGFLMWTESINRVRESHLIAAREAALRARAEASALRARFNPHFVFNTLHSLMLLVRSDPKAAEQAIEDVAALIRYASLLDREGRDTVPLSQELAMAEKYLALESLRLASRMRVEWDVEPGVGGMMVPSLSLQTLLENAIKHGLSLKPEGGTVGIRIGLRGEQLLIRVEDDGLGADPRRVVEAEGRGLSLLGQRVASLYGSSGSLRWRTAPGGGFSVVLGVPSSATCDGDSVGTGETRQAGGRAE